MEQHVIRLIERLARERSFEAAAEAVLTAALEVTTAALERSPFAGAGRVVRATVHFRTEESYLRLVALDAADRKACRLGREEDIPSATAWRWVNEHAASVMIDIPLSIVQVGSGAGSTLSTRQPFDATASRVKLERRAVTHLWGTPLQTPGGRIDGMLTIEADCRAAMGTTFVWEACGPALQTIAAIGAPYLVQLPLTRVEATTPDPYLPVIGPSMQPTVEMLRVFARQDETVLLRGPTGVGKSRFARWCHEQSPAAGKPFETLDLATVPEDLQMAELFGWKKGAFTGATKDVAGRIASAKDGTLFIDEIDKLSLKAQAGLLRMLEERTFRPLGGDDGDRSVKARFIVGTNADLHQLCQKGAFRSDLYFRINVLPVRIPPLRERRDEIVDWARFMLRRRHEMNKARGETLISHDAAARLEGYDWPGNLRQLDNIVRRAYALSLLDCGAATEPATLRASHIERALSYEEGQALGSVMDHLEGAAEAFVTEAQRRAESGQNKLDLDLAEALKGLVIDAAKRRLGNDEKEALRRAFVLLGKDATVEGRNHWALYKREMEKVSLARAALQERGTS
jgi:DNA-binding NtrC family response regulator